MLKSLKRATDRFVGTIEISGRYAFLIPDSHKMIFDIFIPLDELNGAEDGD